MLNGGFNVRATLVSSVIGVLVALLLLCGCEKSEQPVNVAVAKNAAPEWHSYIGDEANVYIKDCQGDFEAIKDRLKTILSTDIDDNPGALLDGLNEIDILLDKQMNLASLYANVYPDEEVRTSAEACEQNFVVLISELSLSRALFNKVKKIDTSALDVLDKRLVLHIMNDFKRAGVDKSKTLRDKISKLNEEINLIGQGFDKNIRSGLRYFTLKSIADLKGLPQDYIDKHPPNEKGEIVLTTTYPDYFPFMQYAESDELRKQFYIIFRQQAYPENKDVLKNLLQKRYELSRLLGYENFSAYITEDKMIKSPAKAQEFIDQVSAIANLRAASDYQTLLTRLQKIDPTATAVMDWQKAYLEELVKKEKYKVDSQDVRQYFQFERVRQGIFNLTETMFGVTIKPWDTKVWHKSVKAYELWDNGEVIGRFYLDMHPREGKYKHAAEFSIINGVAGRQLTTAALVCNFPGEDNPAALLEHSDVETFLHEFGHLLHNLFAGRNQRWMYFSGIKNEWDFVEAPSQMLEEWVWDADTLATFARNEKGEVIPPELVQKMIAGRDFGRGIWTMHQLFYAALSLGFYNQDPATLDLDKAMAKIQAQYSPFGYVDDTYFYTSFGHLNGYSSIYYTYMWSLVIAADMHSEFVRHGLRNSEIANHYRKSILEPGGTKDAADLVQEFLGRPYSFDAFAKDLAPQ